MDPVSHEDRLRRRIARLQRKSARLPSCARRNDLIDQIENDEIALALIKWMKSPCSRRSPGDSIPVRRHKLTH